MDKKNKLAIKIKIQEDDFDVSKETRELQNNNTGAIVNFIGVVRGKDSKTNKEIYSMTLEYYPEMTELEIENIVKSSFIKWDISSVTVIHRVGKLFPSDQIVFVGVASTHRQNSFDACNYIMDWLKTNAPFWKIEEGPKDKKWVDFNLSDISATKKWE